MDHIDFDEMENNYTKSILKTKKTKNYKKRKNTKFNHFATITISLILAIIVVLVILNVITLSMKSEKKSSINNELIDEVVYREKIEIFDDNAVATNEKVEKTEETQVVSKDLTKEPSSTPEQNVEADKSTEVLSKYYAIQVVASKSMDAVKKYIDKIEKKGYEAYFIKEGTSVYHYKVIIKKKFKTRDEADAFAGGLVDKKVIESYWIKLINENQN